MLIFHGDNQVSSRDQFLLAKQSAQSQGFNIVEFSGDQITLPDLVQAVQTSSLFGTTSSIFIENFFATRPSAAKKEISDYLYKNSDKNIFLWESKDVSVQLKTFSPTVIKLFALPKYLFSFLDSPNITSLHQCLRSVPIELIFASLATRLHKVLLGTGRFTRHFSRHQLITMNHELLKIDHAQKTSSAPYDLSAALEIWLNSPPLIKQERLNESS